MKKVVKKAVLCVGNAMTDVIVPVTDEQFAQLGLEKGKAQERPGFQLPGWFTPAYIPGGAAANTAAGLSWHGIPAGFIGTVGRDWYGRNYIRDLRSHRIGDYTAVVDGGSGVVHAFITPDGERTFAFDLGMSWLHDSGRFEEVLPSFGVFYTTGYELAANPSHALTHVEVAQRYGAVTAFDLGSAVEVRNRKDIFDRVLRQADIIFANEDEAIAWAGSVDDAVEQFSLLGAMAVVKLGSKGSIVSKDGHPYRIPCYKADPFVNTNGAGDAYAAGFLAGLLEEKPVDECGHLGSQFAAKVCGQEGPRMPPRTT